MVGIQTFKGSWPWPWPWIRPYGIPSCITHRPLPTYQISFKSKTLFVDGQTYGHSSPYIIRSTFGSRPKKVKCSILLEFRWGAHLSSYGHEPIGGNTTTVCDAWPVWRQTYGYLPSCKAGITAHWLLPNYTACWQRHMCVNNLPRVALDIGEARIRTRDLLIASTAS